MNIVTADQSQKNSAEPTMRANFNKLTSDDKFAEVRKTKKKEKRARHRARLKRSNTNG